MGGSEWIIYIDWMVAYPDELSKVTLPKKGAEMRDLLYRAFFGNRRENIFGISARMPHVFVACQILS